MDLAEFIRRAIEIGESSKTVTFDQLMELDPDFEAEDLEKMLIALTEAGIRVVEP